MSAEISIQLRGKNPPAWALDHHGSRFWYHENEQGEQWVARQEGDILCVAGLDMGWEVIELTPDQVLAERERVRDLLLAERLSLIPGLSDNIDRLNADAAASRPLDPEQYPLGRVLLGTGDLFWIASVLEAALPAMAPRRSRR